MASVNHFEHREYIVCLTGMIFSGNTVVPFSPDITVEEASVLFDDADIDILFCEEEFLLKAEKIKENYSGLKSVISLGVSMIYPSSGS